MAVPASSDKSAEEQALIDALFQRHPDLDRLLWVLNQGDEFGLYFARCNLPEYRRRLSAALIMECERPVVQFDIGAQDYDPRETALDEVLTGALQEVDPAAAVFIYGLEKLLPIKDADAHNRTLQQLNWRRNAYARLKRSLVFWLADEHLTLLAEGAPDFYDWYSGFYEFDVPEHDRPHLTEQALAKYKSRHGVHPGERLSKEDKWKMIQELKGLLGESGETGGEVFSQLYDLGWLYDSLGEYKQALEYYGQTLELTRELGDKEKEGAVLHNMSKIHEQRCEYDIALNFYQQSLSIFREIGNHENEGGSLVSIGDIHKLRGEYDTALDFYQQALKIERKIGSQIWEATSLHSIGDIHEARGEYATALDFYQQSLLLRRELGHRRGEAASLHAIGNIHQARCEYATALDFYQQSLTRRQLGKVLLAQGDLAAAWEHLQAAKAVQEELNVPASLSRTLTALGEYYRAQGDEAQADAQWQAAEAMAQGIGFAWTLRELEKVRGAGE